MVLEQNLCVNCYKPITEPVCFNCHKKMLASRFDSMQLSAKIKHRVIHEISKVLPKESMNENNCVICGKDTLSTCSRCILQEALTAMLKHQVSFFHISNIIEGYGYGPNLLMPWRQFSEYECNKMLQLLVTVEN